MSGAGKPGDCPACMAANPTTEHLIREYLDLAKYRFGRIFGHNASTAQSRVGAELIARGVREIPTIFGPMAVRTDTTEPTGERFAVRIDHGEGATVYSVMDTWAPEPEQPAVIRSWSTAKEPNARYLAVDDCARHNAKEGANG